jgi:hypothetical protein
MSFHRRNKLVFVRSKFQVEHPVKPIHLEMVPYHLSLGRTRAGISDFSVVADTLNCCDGFSDDTLTGDTRRDHSNRGKIPDDPW